MVVKNLSSPTLVAVNFLHQWLLQLPRYLALQHVLPDFHLRFNFGTSFVEKVFAVSYQLCKLGNWKKMISLCGVGSLVAQNLNDPDHD